jgi:hypothetical protein
VVVGGTKLVVVVVGATVVGGAVVGGAVVGAVVAAGRVVAVPPLEGRVVVGAAFVLPALAAVGGLGSLAAGAVSLVPVGRVAADGTGPVAAVVVETGWVVDGPSGSGPLGGTVVGGVALGRRAGGAADAAIVVINPAMSMPLATTLMARARTAGCLRISGSAVAAARRSISSATRRVTSSRDAQGSPGRGGSW